MPVSKKYKTIFIHIPKNAGESMEKKLGIFGDRMDARDSKDVLWGVHGKYILQHLTISQMRRLFITEKVYKSYYKFAFVRNPWDKAVSEYHWYLRYSAHVSFKDWATSLSNRLQVTSNLQWFEVGHNVPQYKYIYDNDGVLLVDFVGRFEHLQRDFDEVCKRLGIEDSNLPHSESTVSEGKKPYKEYYCLETIGIIASVYKKDIELFNYEF